MTGLRLGLVGLGVIGRFCVAAIEANPALRLAAICDRRPEVLDGAPPGPARFTDHRRMLVEAGLDGVVVTAPNDTHHAICRDALRAGVAVCVEKPLATRLADAHDLAALAESTGVPLFTAFHRRYNDNVRALLAGLNGAAPVAVTVRYWELIEEHVGTDAWYLDPQRCGGGCVADNGPNAFDLVRLLLGDVEVRGARIERNRSGVDRRAVIDLAAPGGAAATVDLDWSFPGETKDVLVRLADGSTRRADLLAGHPGFKNSLWHEYRGVLADFARLVADRRPGHAEGVAALSLVDACYRIEEQEKRTP